MEPARGWGRVRAVTARYRPVSLGSSDVDVTRRADGSIVVRSRLRLGAFPLRLTDRLDEFAARDPERGLSAERPVVVLSGNDFEHALIQLGALYAGIPYAPVLPAYSLVSTDHAKLRSIMGLLTPGLVYA